MKKIVEVNYVGIDDVKYLIDMVVKLNELGHYACVELALSYGHDIIFYFMKNGWHEGNYDVDEYFDLDDPDNIDPENYEKYVKLLEKINAILDEGNGMDGGITAWRTADKVGA